MPTGCDGLNEMPIVKEHGGRIRHQQDEEDAGYSTSISTT